VPSITVGWIAWRGYKGLEDVVLDGAGQLLPKLECRKEDHRSAWHSASEELCLFDRSNADLFLAMCRTDQAMDCPTKTSDDHFLSCAPL